MNKQQREEFIRKQTQKNLQKRIDLGKDAIVEAKWPIWEEFVRNYSKEPFYTSELDIIIKFIELLNTEAKTSLVATIFKEHFPEVGDSYTTELLMNIARFHERGIELFEYLRDKQYNEASELNVQTNYLNQLKDIELLLKLGEDIHTATTIASHHLATIKIDGIDHIVVVSKDNNFMGVKPDYMIIGQLYDEENHIIYCIEKDKTNSYLTYHGETIDILIDGTIIGPFENKIQVESYEADILDIQEEYDVAYSRYVKQDVPTLLKVLKDIRNLTSSSDNKPTYERLFKDYKQDIQFLTKSAK